MISDPKIYFNRVDTKYRIKKSKCIKQAIQDILKQEGVPANRIRIILCRDSFLWEINREFLNHDTFTDVITFNYPDKKIKTVTIRDAEIYISIDRIKENAGKFKVSISEELNRVIFHGVLHLCGYSDKGPRKRRLMSALEDKYLFRYCNFNVQK